MAASMLNSQQAVEVSIFVVRAFVKLREIISSNIELAHKLEELERKHDTHDVQIKAVFDAIRQLMKPVPNCDKFLGKFSLFIALI